MRKSLLSAILFVLVLSKDTTIFKTSVTAPDMTTVITSTSRILSSFFKDIFSFSCKRSRMELHFNSSADSVTSSEHNHLLKNVQEFIPKLTTNLHKGQCGRVGVIGGSFEYTGAPYFAAISSLKVGVDLVHVFCCREAGPVIKSYSPELIVHPFLDSRDVVSKIQPWLERLHALVIGPGMGRDADLLKNVGDIITHCKTNMTNPPALIIDADGLYLITEDVNLVRDYPGPLILTPNSVEFTRLSDKMVEKDALKIAATLNAVLLQKGHNDVISNGIRRGQPDFRSDDLVLRCDLPGSNRRCGGQGDVLSGCIAAFVAWLQIHLSRNSNFNFNSFGKSGNQDYTYMRYSWAVYGACAITRTCSRLAFEDKGRGMTATDMISYIHKAFQLYFGI